MDQDEHDSIIDWFLYKEFPKKLQTRDSKKAFKKKMKKYKYEPEKRKLFHHLNDKVCKKLFIHIKKRKKI